MNHELGLDGNCLYIYIIIYTYTHIYIDIYDMYLIKNNWGVGLDD